MKLSIIIPAYNMEAYIERCLDSIYKENVADEQFEVIIVNDGSKDNTLNIVKRYTKNKSNLRVINQDNAGVSAARNNGISQATGDYLTFVDADDNIAEGALVAVFSKLNQQTFTPDLIYLRAHLDPSGRECTTWKCRILSEMLIEGDNLFEKAGLVQTVWGCLYRREFLNANALTFAVGVKNSEDTIFMSECQVCAKYAAFWMIPFYLYYFREDSAYNNVIEGKLVGYQKGLEYSKSLFSKYDSNNKRIKALLYENLYLFIANFTIASILCPKGNCKRMVKDFHIKDYLPIDNNYGSPLKSRITIINLSYYLFYAIMSFAQKRLKAYDKWK